MKYLKKLNTCIKFINPEHLLPILVINLNRKVKNTVMISYRKEDTICDTVLCPEHS